jgi:hypothetical protein
MDLNKIIANINLFFEWIKFELEAVELRWLWFLISVFFLIIFKSVGLSGLALLIALIYIMFYVTFRQ